MSNIMLSAFADEYASPFTEQLEGMSRFGIQFVELRHADGKNVADWTREDTREIRAKLDHFGIRASAVGSPLGKIRLDGDLDAHMESAKRVFEIANTVGAKYIRMFSFYAPEGRNITDMRGEVLDALERLVLLAREHGVILCHENEAKIYGDVPARCLELIEHFDGELKCVFDMGNFVLEGVDPYPEAYKLLQKHIAYFHIKDALKSGAIVPPGKGEAHIRELLDAHRAYSNEDFFISLEPHLQVFSGLDSLVGRAFENPYEYPDAKTAFTDAVTKIKELI